MSFFIKYLGESDYKTKTQWLIALFCLNILFPLVLHGVICGILFFYNIQEKPPIELLIYGGCGLMPLCVLWYCIYKMPGTKLLTLFLFLAPLQMLSDIFQVMLGNPDRFQTSTLSVEVVLFIWCYWLAIKVRRINRKLAVWKPKPRSF